MSEWPWPTKKWMKSFADRLAAAVPGREAPAGHYDARKWASWISRHLEGWPAGQAEIMGLSDAELTEAGPDRFAWWSATRRTGKELREKWFRRFQCCQAHFAADDLEEDRAGKTAVKAGARPRFHLGGLGDGGSAAVIARAARASNRKRQSLENEEELRKKLKQDAEEEVGNFLTRLGQDLESAGTAIVKLRDLLSTGRTLMDNAAAHGSNIADASAFVRDRLALLHSQLLGTLESCGNTAVVAGDAVEPLLAAIERGAVRDPALVPAAAALYEKVAGMPACQGGLRVAHVEKSVPKKHFTSHFGLPSLSTVNMLADMCDFLFPYKDLRISGALSEEELANLKTYVQLLCAPTTATQASEEDALAAAEGAMDVDPDVDSEDGAAEDDTMADINMDVEEDQAAPAATNTTAAETTGQRPPQVSLSRDRRGVQKALSAVECVLLVLYVLRMGSTQPTTALAFGISQATVSRYFAFGLQWLYRTFKAMEEGDHEKAMLAPPSELDPEEMHFCIILDGTEIGIQRMTDMYEHRAFYSTYKSRDTLKWLVGLSPLGAISFVSDAYPGSISDADLTEVSGILSRVMKGQAGGIMADKGFLIERLCADHDTHLIVPPRKRRGTDQFVLDDVIRTKIVATRRIYVGMSLEWAFESALFRGLTVDCSGFVDRERHCGNQALALPAAHRRRQTNGPHVHGLLRRCKFD
jgi:hypothetical protein